MLKSPLVAVNTKAGHISTKRFLVWSNILVGIVVLACFAVGIWMRLHDLSLPLDRDGYDEGVYWQSLRAMSQGHPLYQQIFYSQPPFFLLAIFPTYLLFGQTLWAARIGIVLISLLGLLGAFLLGKALGGRIGALASLLLLMADPLYLTQSQNIQAEAPSAALMLLGVGMAYLWWETPEGWTGICFATLSALALSLGILCKLLAVAGLVPVGLLMLAHLWRTFQQPSNTRLASIRPVLLGIAAFLITTAIVCLPFIGFWPQALQQVITFHVDAGNAFKATQSQNTSMIAHALFSIPGSAALYGTVVALLRRDWRVLPLIAWLLATCYLLWQQTPLFHHHFVMLTLPLIALAIMGLGPITFKRQRSFSLNSIATIMAILIILLVAVTSLQESQLYLSDIHEQSLTQTTQQDLQVAHDLHDTTPSNQLVITDAQFIAGLADRSTPAFLVDTSTVRLATNYVTEQQLIQQASQPQVHTVLVYTGRLYTSKRFYAWVTQHFHLVKSYGSGQELWIKI